MISDDDLYKLAIVLGSVAMVLIVVYHFFEVNNPDNVPNVQVIKAQAPQQAPAAGKQSNASKS